MEPQQTLDLATERLCSWRSGAPETEGGGRESEGAARPGGSFGIPLDFPALCPGAGASLPRSGPISSRAGHTPL